MANPDRELQMTTIDPHDFEQGNLNKGFGTILDERLQDYSNFYEPSVKVWSNVTFADNYYQTRANPSVLNAFSATPNGRILEGADINEELTDLTGFKHDNGLGNTHTRALAWYAGTVSLNAEKFNVKPGTTPPLYTAEEQTIYDALGSRALIGMNIDSQGKLGNSWYQRSAAGEGIGEGWAFSILGGGKNLRPSISNLPREDVKTDNTATARQRGDFAVPTLFDGNFDAIIQSKANQAIPGWLLNNGSVDAQSYLKCWDQINGLTQDYNRLAKDPAASPLDPPNGQFTHPSYLKTIGYDPSNPSYAIELGGGDILIHNAFVVPDNGRLRFNVHVEDPAENNDKSNFVQMFLIDETGKEIELSGLPLATPTYILNGANPIISPTDGSTIVALDLREVKPKPDNVESAQGQANRVSFGSYGFETFSADIPAEMRGKVAKLKIVVNGSKKVYLDDIFFGSEHLLPGNLTNAKGDLEAGLNLTNFLLEKPGYAVSYNNDLKTANWVSYKLDRSWMNSDAVNVRPNIFVRDFQLNSPQTNNLYPKFDIVNARDIDGTNSGYERGHIVDARQRERIATSVDNVVIKDYYSTFVMSNVFPEFSISQTPSTVDPWIDLAVFLAGTLVGTYEESTRKFTGQDKELYIIAGRDGAKTAPGVNISIPESLWRVVLVLNHGQKLADATENNMAFAVYLPNDASRGNKNWRDQQYLMSVSDLETKLKQSGNNYDFFSNLPTQIRSSIKKRDYGDIYNWIAGGVYPLLAEERSTSNFNPLLGEYTLPVSESSRSLRYFLEPNRTSEITANPDSTIRFTSPLEIRIPQVAMHKDGICQTTTMEIDVSATTSAKSGIVQVGSSQVDSVHMHGTQCGSEEISFTEIGIKNNAIAKIRSSQFNTTQILSSPIPGTSTDTNSHKGEIPSTSSIEPQNFVVVQPFSVNHNISRQVQDIELAAVSLWLQQLHSTTPINLKIEVTDLPVGQLAEATVTGYDVNGRPNSGTLTLDIDGNSLGWFIDTTPCIK